MPTEMAGPCPRSSDSVCVAWGREFENFAFLTSSQGMLLCWSGTRRSRRASEEAQHSLTKVWVLPAAGWGMEGAGRGLPNSPFSASSSSNSMPPLEDLVHPHCGPCVTQGYMEL